MKLLISVALVLTVFVGLVACQGAVGPAGIQGNPGPQGGQGIAGPPGATGLTGPEGSTGPIGPQGESGSEGPQGETGSQGEPGPAGEKGAIGPKGQAGDTGVAGVAGPIGLAGVDGGDYHELFLPDSDIKDHVVWIDAGSATGSAVVIGAGELLTAEHVITGKSIVQASIPGVGLVNAVVKGWDKTRDLALLTFSSTGEESITVISEGSTWTGSEWTSNGLIGSPVIAIGYVTPVSNSVPMTSFGHISTWWNIVPGEVSTYGFNADVTNGMSGGGLFDMDGELIGTIIQKSTVIGSDNRAVRYDEIKEVLADLRAGANNQ
jgi:S1-C subfamily serine protease